MIVVDSVAASVVDISVVSVEIVEDMVLDSIDVGDIVVVDSFVDFVVGTSASTFFNGVVQLRQIELVAIVEFICVEDSIVADSFVVGVGMVDRVDVVLLDSILFVVF